MKKKQLVLIILFPLISLLNLQAGPVIPIGDVNRGGTRDVVDALLIARYSAGLVSQFNLFMNVADVNLDNTVNIVDAMQIAQVSAGLSEGLAAEAPYNQFQNQLDTAKKQWQFQQLYNYSMNLKRSCFCQDTNTIYRIEVALGAKTAVINTTDNSQVATGMWNQYPSIEELFVVAQDAIDRKYIIRSMTFDPKYSFPLTLSMDPDKFMADEEMMYTVSSYQPADPIPPITWTSQSPEELAMAGSTVLLRKAVINGNMLSIQLEYGGGCFEHKFNVYADDTVYYSMPPQIIIYVQDTSKGDSCMAIVTRTLNIDLTPIRTVLNSPVTLIIPTDGYYPSHGAFTLESK